MNKIQYQMIEAPLENHGHPVWDVLAYGFIVMSCVAFIVSMRD